MYETVQSHMGNQQHQQARELIVSTYTAAAVFPFQPLPSCLSDTPLCCLCCLQESSAAQSVCCGSQSVIRRHHAA